MCVKLVMYKNYDFQALTSVRYFILVYSRARTFDTSYLLNILVFNNKSSLSKHNLQEVGCGGMDWIDLGQERGSWRALCVCVVMKLGVP